MSSNTPVSQVRRVLKHSGSGGDPWQRAEDLGQRGRGCSWLSFSLHLPYNQFGHTDPTHQPHSMPHWVLAHTCPGPALPLPPPIPHSIFKIVYVWTHIFFSCYIKLIGNHETKERWGQSVRRIIEECVEFMAQKLGKNRGLE